MPHGLGFYFVWDNTYILVVIGALLSMLASARVKSAYGRYENVRCMSGITGAEAAKRILNYAGITGVSIVRTSGHLTDHYNPSTRQIALSESVYGSTSIAAVAVAAHECGHVIQHQKQYAPLSFRTTLVPVAKFGSAASWFFILGGILFGFGELITVGIVLFSAAVLFQLVTLPVEFNASKRALVVLQETGILAEQEKSGAKSVLSAAALTYVASAAAAILSLLRLIILFGRKND